ncbi:MAG: tetratricopeptide repeat protein [Candidatus Schekmanbacteria bacterium]|nr:tetratricopeptide repeat protein [Candidatus Schekmanbacteria bacterium]
MTPVPARIGPYHALEPIGQGGMGIVYRATHEITGRLVAIKTVVVPHPSLLAGIQREIRTLARIRHPGVVRIVDDGIDSGAPWYAMELLEGLTMRRVLAANGAADHPDADATQPLWWTKSLEGVSLHVDAPIPPILRGGGVGAVASAGAAGAAATSTAGRQAVDTLRLRAALTLIGRLCAPLAYLHGEGIIHRDLKPDNVLVRPGGYPVIVDFGLMTHFGDDVSREALFVGRQPAGTVAYMAPEQVRGEEVDARADLYALGCILFELLAGRPPFTGSEPYQVLWSHLEAAPPRISSFLSGVPDGLDELLISLLAKEPRDRIGHATELARRLAALGAEDVDWAPAFKPRDFLYRPGLAGRADTLKELDWHLWRLQARTGGLVLLGGESGVGKTRLGVELAKRAVVRGIWVLSGECAAVPSPAEAAGDAPAVSSLQVLRRPLRTIGQWCRTRGQTETERIFGRRAKVLGVYEPALLDLPGVAAHPTPARLPAEAALHRLKTYLTDVFAAASTRSPLLLLLDDLQWADELSLTYLQHLARTGVLGRHPVLIVGAYRIEEATAQLRDLAGSQGLRSIWLGRLGEKALQTMIADILGTASVPAPFVRFVVRQSEGNPFFVAEYLRSASASGLLRRDAGGGITVAGEDADDAGALSRLLASIALPGSLRELIEERLDALPRELREIVEVAAVAGHDAVTELIRARFALSEERWLEAIDELERRQVLRFSGAQRVRFIHDKLREVAYEAMDPERRRATHMVIAEALEDLTERSREEHLAILGHHWERAGARERARSYYLLGARQSVARSAHGDAERFYRAYLALNDTPTLQSVQARQELARDVLILRGRTREAEIEYEIALETAAEVGDRAGIAASLHGLATVHSIAGNSGLSEEYCQRADDLFRELGDVASRGSVLSDRARIYFARGELEQAQELFAQALALHRASEDRWSEGVTAGRLATVLLTKGRLAEATALFGTALSVNREVGNQRAVGIALNNLANIEYAQGRLAAARDIWQEALVIHREVGDRRTEGITLGNLAAVHAADENSGTAAELLDQALRIIREVGDRPMEGALTSNLALVMADRGQPVQALELCQRALTIQRSVGDRIHEAATLREMAALERRVCGNLQAATRLLDEAVVLARDVGDQVSVGLCEVERGLLQLAIGLPATAAHNAAAAILAALGLESASELGKGISRLARAIAAERTGIPLFRGECPADLPRGLQSWLRGEGLLGDFGPT